MGESLKFKTATTTTKNKKKKNKDENILITNMPTSSPQISSSTSLSIGAF